ncbi:MAG: hypothetical protein Q8P18_27165 [Pseudomonadota bacterium]|nr:hypothetical protein [Pseudomonadota bacterium]
MADGAAIRAMVAAGEVRPTDEVATPDGWIRVDQHPVLRLALRGSDPWAAWSDVDSVDAASLYRKMVDTPTPDELAELPSEALSPLFEVNRGEVNRGEVNRGESSRPAVALVEVTEVTRPPPPMDRAPVPMEPVRAARPMAPPLFSPLPEDGAEVIDFPRQRPFPRGGAPNLPPRRPTGPPPLVRTTRLLTMVFAGLFLVMLGYAWIRLNGYTGLGAGTLEARMASARATSAVAAPTSPLVALDAQLRADLTATPRAVEKAGDLTDALLVELVRQRLDHVEATGVVTKWIGKKGDEPRTAEVRITYRSSGDMSRELGAIALVVGRYKHLYHLEVPVFEVTEVSARGLTKLDANKAELYYQARITLEELLTSITEP